ncbi:porin [Polaromonas hydrogenivorans]|uniref:Porin n=1 Tax=Polaromonas hydrogenivorans TaxID=335476 RepID=A0AAU7M001_9BURK
MKKSLITLAVLTAPCFAMAQSSVTLYGVADAFVGSKKTNTLTAVGANLVASNLRQTMVESNGLSGSRWGLRANEDLGGGLKAFATLESGLNIDTGAGQQGALLFGRQAFVGLGGNFGGLSLGRHYSAFDAVRGAVLSAQNSAYTFDATNGYGGDFTETQLKDLQAYNQAATPANQVARAPAAAAALARSVARMGAWTGYVPRIDNSIRYETPNISGFQGVLVYGFGENKTATTGATKNGSASLTYVNGPIAVALVHQDDELAKGFHLKNTAVGGNYDFGLAKAFLAYNQAKFTGLAKQNEWAVGIRAPLGATTLVAQYAHAKGDDLGKNQSLGLQVEYTLSKRTTAYAALNQTRRFDSLAKNDVFGLGMRHTF